MLCGLFFLTTRAGWWGCQLQFPVHMTVQSAISGAKPHQNNLLLPGQQVVVMALYVNVAKFSPVVFLLCTPSFETVLLWAHFLATLFVSSVFHLYFALSAYCTCCTCGSPSKKHNHTICVHYWISLTNVFSAECISLLCSLLNLSCKCVYC